MEVFLPVASDLDFTGSPASYVNPAWASGTFYNINTVVRYEDSNGVWYDYRATYSHTANSANAPTARYGLWQYLSPAAVSGGYTYTTNVAPSFAATWTSGRAVAAGAIVFDEADRRDYAANIALTGGNNTLRPSEAVMSSDETIRSRWVCLGAANAWAALDTTTESVMIGESATGLLINPNFTVNFDTGAALDRIAIAGFDGAACTLVPTVNGVAGSAISLPHNRLYSPLALSNATYWTLTNATLAASGTAPNGVSTEAAYALRETTATGTHRLLYSQTVTCNGYTPFTFSISAKTVNTRRLIVRLHAVDDAGIVLDAKITHFLFNLTTGTVAGISSGTNLINATQTISALGSGWYRCVANAAVPEAAKGLVICVLASNSDSVPATDSLGPSYAGSASAGLDLSAAQLVTGLGTHPWYGKSANNELPRHYIFPIAAKAAGQTCSVTFYLYPWSATKKVELALVCAGQAQYIGEADWGVETSYLSYSRRERDETFGAVNFIKRGAARTVRATGYLDPETRQGDLVQRAIIAADGQPAMWDFNNSGSDYDRLRIFGFASAFSSVIQAASFESVSLTVEGLVE